MRAGDAIISTDNGRPSQVRPYSIRRDIAGAAAFSALR